MYFGHVEDKQIRVVVLVQFLPHTHLHAYLVGLPQRSQEFVLNFIDIKNANYLHVLPAFLDAEHNSLLLGRH